MGMRISTNIESINAQRNLTTTGNKLQGSFAKIASGSRINKAADDAAGLAISENLKAQIRGIRQANRNANDGVSLVQTAEGGLNEIGNIVVRLRELAVQSSSDTMDNTARGFIDVEVQQLKSEVDRIAKTTAFGSHVLLDGSNQKFDFQIGTNNDDFNDRISFDSGRLQSTLDTLGLGGISFAEKTSAQESLEVLDTAQTTVSSHRAELGALQNRLQSTMTNLSVAEENISAANSRIRDTDVASEAAEMTKNNILQQAGTSVLAQANQSKAAALKLLG